MVTFFSPGKDRKSAEITDDHENVENYKDLIKGVIYCRFRYFPKNSRIYPDLKFLSRSFRGKDAERIINGRKRRDIGP